jgi:hypothetical protein
VKVVVCTSEASHRFPNPSEKVPWKEKVEVDSLTAKPGLNNTDRKSSAEMFTRIESRVRRAKLLLAKLIVLELPRRRSEEVLKEFRDTVSETRMTITRAVRSSARSKIRGGDKSGVKSSAASDEQLVME